jgi:GT2 family glycosyltransferase
MNEGIEKAYKDGTDYIFVGNADSQLTPGFLDTIIPLLEKNPQYLFLSGIREDEVNVQLLRDTGDQRFAVDIPVPAVNYDPDFAAFVFKREAIDILKAKEPVLVAQGKMKYLTDGILFDNRIKFVYTEDDCLKIRTYLAGYKFAKVNHCVFKHLVSYSSKTGHGEGAKENWAYNFGLFKQKYGMEVHQAPWRFLRPSLSDFKF